MNKRDYCRPTISSQVSFDASALACAKTPVPPPGSFHFTGAYDTLTGHCGPAMGVDESYSPCEAGVGFGPGMTSVSYSYSGLCSNWITLAS